GRELLARRVGLLADRVDLPLQAVDLLLDRGDRGRGRGTGTRGPRVNRDPGRGREHGHEDRGLPHTGPTGKALGHDVVTLRSSPLAFRQETVKHGSEGYGCVSTDSRKPHERITDSHQPRTECALPFDPVESRR